ncbi:TIGR00341 family protein [Halopenitus malekzadehii]|uniref:TIGR00341 family protein n=2 Tax=Halopenitus malekzadehii TaxID=1267564 RepID=A0A1H6JDV1_9EURY|nr:TIGR00341 family protein [Halopenitus malekzadehii]SEH57042.1 TIGR00341 family protein [Halopenitus malekzadehii]
MIPAGKRAAILDALDEEGIDYVVTDETSGRKYTGVVSFPLPTAAVEPVLDRLREAGIDEETYTVIVDAETVISRRFEQLEERYAEESDHSEDRIAKEELQTKATGLVSGIRTYVLMTVISAVIATAGLLLDSPATVVGSMVIAPLIGPAMSAAVGTVVDDDELFGRGVRLQILGVVLAVGSAAVFAAGLRTLNLVPPGLDPLALAEVSERLAPNVLVLAVALGAGIAGVLSLMTGVSSALVGVMIAVALIPPAAAVGIGIAFGIPRLALGAGVLVLVNVLSINLAALVVLWYEGYRPDSWFREAEAKSALLKRVTALLAAIAILSVFLGGVTYDTYVATTTEQDVREAVESELALAEAQLDLIDLEVHRTGSIPPLRTERVVITVGSEPGTTVAGLAARLDDRIEPVVDGQVAVEVRVLTVDRSG